MSFASYVEAHIVVRRRFAGTERSRALFDRIASRYGIAIEALQEAHARLAVEAYHVYGKGGGTGVLEFGDCFAYALAKHRNDVLLFLGNDFAQTDIRKAIV
jgi:ribonuclease VapC